MSDFSSQGVGAAPCANAHVENPVRTAAAKAVFAKMLVIFHPPHGHSASLPHALNKSRTVLSSQLAPSTHHAAAFETLSFPAFDFATMLPFRLQSRIAKNVIGMVRMNHVMKIG